MKEKTTRETLKEKILEKLKKWEWEDTFILTIYCIILSIIIMMFVSVISKKKIEGYYLHSYSAHDVAIIQKIDWVSDKAVLEFKEMDPERILKIYKEFCKTHKCL